MSYDHDFLVKLIQRGSEHATMSQLLRLYRVWIYVDTLDTEFDHVLDMVGDAMHDHSFESVELGCILLQWA